MGRVRDNWSYARRWAGFALLAAGGGLLLEHYISYGFTLHLTPLDHGVLGLILVVLGALGAAGRPDRHAPPPG